MARLDLKKLETAKVRIGEAAVDPTQWVSLMEDVCAATGTAGAALLQSDVRTPDIPTTRSAAEYFKNYFHNNLHLNDVRAVRGVPLLLSGKSVVTDQDIFRSEREMMRDPLYANLDEFGIRWWAAIGFQAGSALWGFALQRTPQEGPFEAFEVAALAQLSQSLTNAATLSHASGRQVLLGVINALNHIKKPALAMDRYGLVIDANDSANALFDDELRIRGRRLIVADGAARASLDDLVDELRNGQQTEALSVAPIVVRRRDRRPIIIQAVPVPVAAKSPFLGARVILILNDLDQKRSIQASLLLKAFDLTPAQARIASLLVKDLSLEEIANSLSVTRETVRNQLKAIFAKTGTSRQAELVSLLLRLDL